MSSVLGVWGVLSQKMTKDDRGGGVVLEKMKDDNDRAKDNNRKTM